VVTPVANGTFLSGITRARVIDLLARRVVVEERSVRAGRAGNSCRNLQHRQLRQGYVRALRSILPVSGRSPLYGTRSHSFRHQ
jgi:hypothetical protein